MTAEPAVRLVLITPPLAEPAALQPMLGAALAAGDIAAVVMPLATADERTRINRVKAIAPLVQQHDAALLLADAADIVARAGADGAHVSFIPALREAREALKKERIVGISGLTTRHDAMEAGEAGADYLMFGAPKPDGWRLPPEQVQERVNWWAELFETPCVGYAGSLEEVTPLVEAGADFIALGPWALETAPAETVRAALALIASGVND